MHSSSKPSTRLLSDLALIREKLQAVEDSPYPTVDKINPLRKIDQHLSLRLLDYLSSELNMPLALPKDYPDPEETDSQDDEVPF